MTAAGFSEFSVELTRNDGRVTISITGELDAYTSPRLTEAVSGVIGTGLLDVVLDAREITFLDSTGLGTIVHAHKRLKDQGASLAISQPCGAVYKVIEMTGIHRVIPVVDA